MEAKSEEQFLRDYNFRPADLLHAGISYRDLLQIESDFRAKSGEYDEAGISVLRSLLRFGIVHALKYRIKDPEHLIAKIVRYRLKDPSLIITCANYEDLITDLIGIRVLHLVKSHWYEVHEILQKHYDQLEPPVANVRAGDPEPLLQEFISRGCRIRVHPHGYRSVHYLVGTAVGNREFKAEVQVRTIFEESWGEVDHAVRYPRLTDEPLMLAFLEILNRLAGSADEMAEFVLGFKVQELDRHRLAGQLREQIADALQQLQSSPGPAEREVLLPALERLRALIDIQGSRPLLTSIYLPDKDEET